VCREATLAAITEAIEGNVDHDEVRVREEHVCMAVENIEPQITAEMRDFYQSFGNSHK